MVISYSMVNMNLYYIERSAWNLSKYLENAKNIPRGSERNNLFFTAFTFRNLENLNSMMSYMEPECM